jgi:hypothetical protein
MTGTQAQVDPQALADAIANPLEFLFVPGDPGTRNHHYGELGRSLPASNWLARSRYVGPDGKASLILTEVRAEGLPTAIRAAKERDQMRILFPVSEFPGCLTQLGG